MTFAEIATVNQKTKIKICPDFVLGIGVGLSIGALWTIAALIACSY